MPRKAPRFESDVEEDDGYAWDDAPAPKKKRKGPGKRSGGGNNSERRRRAMPPKKKDNGMAVIAISAITAGLLLAVGIAVINRSSRGTKTVVDDSVELQAALDKLEAGTNAFGEFNAAQRDGKPSRELGEKALKLLQKGSEDLLNLLSRPPYVDENTGYTKPEYEGYEEELSRVSQLIIDIEKRLEQD